MSLLDNDKIRLFSYVFLVSDVSNFYLFQTVVKEQNFCCAFLGVAK